MAFACDVSCYLNLLAIGEGLEIGVGGRDFATQLNVKRAGEEDRAQGQGCAEPGAPASEEKTGGEK